MKKADLSKPARFSSPLAGFGAGLIMTLCLAGCATEVAHHTLLNPAARPAPKSGNYPISVHRDRPPARPFTRVAILDVHCESQGFLMPTLEQDAIPALIQEARKAGCDAIIEIEERRGPDNWTLETRVKRFTAVGIAYK